MASTDKIAADNQRKLIPREWLIVFNEWTNESLKSLAADVTAQSDQRAYAGWELDYREAFGIHVDDPPPPINQRPGTILERWEQHRQQAIKETQ